MAAVAVRTTTTAEERWVGRSIQDTRVNAPNGRGVALVWILVVVVLVLVIATLIKYLRS